jgi:hypothetical protein
MSLPDVGDLRVARELATARLRKSVLNRCHGFFIERNRAAASLNRPEQHFRGFVLILRRELARLGNR